jgi:anthrone oxygenase-like protein
MGSIALWALVIALGLQTGAGIYETRVIVPLWAAAPQRFFSQPLRPDSGKRLWIILSPILSIISIINLIIAFGAAEPKRTWWIAASAISVAVMIVTFAYFVPSLLAIARAAEGDDVTAKAKTWVALNYVRAITVITAWLLALKAFSYVG